MAIKDQNKPCCNWPAKIVLLAWLLAGLTMSYLVGGHELFERFPKFFGTNITNYSLPAINFLRQESRPFAPRKR